MFFALCCDEVVLNFEDVNADFVFIDYVPS